MVHKKIGQFAFLVIFLMMFSALTLSINFTHAQTYYQYNFTGPYYYDGSVPGSNQTAAITTLWANGTRYNFEVTVTSLGSSVSTFNLVSTNPLYQILWNSSTTLGLVSIIDFQPLATPQNINIYIPASSSPTFNYTFPITDFVGMTNAYLECSLSTNGVNNNMLEMVSLSAIPQPTFVLAQYGTYTLTFICDQGTYSQSFTALGTLSNNLEVLAGAFQTANGTYPTADATRLNSTLIGITYTDPMVSTDIVNFLITHTSGTITVLDYNNTETGTSTTILWNNADSQTSYTVTVTASISNATSAYGATPQWQIAVPQTATTNPWLGAFDWLGQYTPTMPYTPTGWTGANGTQISSSLIAEFIGMAIILLFLGVGSYRSSGVTCIIAWLMSGILIFLGWWGSGTTGALSAIPSFALCGFVAIFITLGENKQTEREV